jgi:hypothetical protein
MRIHDSLAGSKRQLTKEYRNNFFLAWRCG